MGPYSVVVVDDHELYREGVRAVVSRFGQYEVVGEAADGHGAIEVADQRKPALMVLGLDMPGMSGIDALPGIRMASPDTRVLAVSAHESHGVVMRCLRSGAQGCVLRSMESAELRLALKALMQGQRYLSPAVSAAVLDRALFGDGAQADAADVPQRLLTPRQMEILTLVASGQSARAIAADLQVSVKTVEAHRAQIMERLGIRDVPRLVLYAVKHGLVSPGEAQPRSA
ncbi:MAG: response regulator transcription factor [Aquabacterium sp.]